MLHALLTIVVVLAFSGAACDRPHENDGGGKNVSVEFINMIRSLNADEKKTFEDTELCTNLSAEDPPIDPQQALSCDPKYDNYVCCINVNGNLYGGFYDVTLHAVLLPEQSKVSDSCRGYGRAHEMIHHLLLASTGDSDAEHRSPLFCKCGQESALPYCHY